MILCFLTHYPFQACWSQWTKRKLQREGRSSEKECSFDLAVKENATVLSLRVGPLSHLPCGTIKCSCTNISPKLLKKWVGLRWKVFAVLGNLPTCLTRLPLKWRQSLLHPPFFSEPLHLLAPPIPGGICPGWALWCTPLLQICYGRWLAPEYLQSCFSWRIFILSAELKENTTRAMSLPVFLKPMDKHWMHQGVSKNRKPNCLLISHLEKYKYAPIQRLLEI